LRKFVIVVVGFLILAAGTIVALPRVLPVVRKPMSQTYIKDNGYFYRLKATFGVRESGEELSFDYVVACNLRVTRWRSGGSSDDSSISPKAMVMATRDGHAVMIRTLHLCSGPTTENGMVPPDVLPLAVWFDDVDDLSAGVGYLSEDAYDSPLSRLTFRAARIERATREDWEKWRQSSAAEYVQRGKLPGPWGYDFPNQTPPELGQYISTCETYRRFKLPEELRAKLRALWPQDKPRYWTLPKDIDWSQFRGMFWPHIRNRISSGDLHSGQPLRSGQIVQIPPHVPSSWPPEMYPLLWRRLSSAFPMRRSALGNDSDFVLNLEYREGATNGFAACQDARDDLTYRIPASSAAPVFEVDGTVIKELDRKIPVLSIPKYFAERDEAVFLWSGQNF